MSLMSVDIYSFYTAGCIETDATLNILRYSYCSEAQNILDPCEFEILLYNRTVDHAKKRWRHVDFP